MIKIIFGLCIFGIVLFIYLHVLFHLKQSNDLEIYELEDMSKDKLEEVCDIRQPFIFNINEKQLTEHINYTHILNNYASYEIKVRNSNDNDNSSDVHIPISLEHAAKLFNEDKKSEYFSEKNDEFLRETGINNKIKRHDEFLKPYMSLNSKYDILFGSKNSFTPFKYEINYRNYIYLTEGSAEIKLAPPCSIKYLSPEHDYDLFEFKSPINPWNPAAEYQNDFNKVKCINYTLSADKILFIPAYWWYSIKFNEPNTSISCFYYGTYMSNISVLPHYLLYALQLQNIKRKIIKNINNDNNSGTTLDIK